MTKLFPNPYLFFLLDTEGFLVWDYKNHKQYILDDAHIAALRQLPCDASQLAPTVIENLRAGNLVSEQPHNAHAPWGWDVLSKIFHVGTQNVYQDIVKNKADFSQHYLEKCESLSSTAPALFPDKCGKTITLPSPNIPSLEATAFWAALKKRKTCREFFSQKMALETLSTLLYASFGLIHGTAFSEEKNIYGMRKASPASGGLHAEMIYVMVYRVADLIPGIYYYHPKNHTLLQMKLGEFEETVIAANYQQYYSRGLSCGIYLACQCDKVWWKYKHSRAFKVALLDMGHVSQTFLLTATALGLHTWITAAFEDDKVHELLEITECAESVLLFLGAGYGSDKTLPEEMA